MQTNKIEKMIYLTDVPEMLGVQVERVLELVEKGHLKTLTDFTNGKQFTYNAWINKAKAMLKPQRQTAPLTVKAPIYRFSAILG